MSGRLRLRVDPLYLGESLSSFVDRTAQYYCMSTRELLGQLRESDGNFLSVPQLDYMGRSSLSARLAEAVIGWKDEPYPRHFAVQPLLRNHLRAAYCPRCFVEDLAAGRTPYFRLAWASFYVTCCPEHRSPLFEWHDVGREGRKLPGQWIYQEPTSAQAFPPSFREDLAFLDTVEAIDLPEIYGGLGWKRMVEHLLALQRVMEIAGSAPEPTSFAHTYKRRDITDTIVDLTRVAISWMWGVPNTPRSYAGLEPRAGMFEYVTTSGRFPRGVPTAVANLHDLRWRRTLLLFIARSLAGGPALSQLMFPDVAIATLWRTYWEEIQPMFSPGHWAHVMRVTPGVTRFLDSSCVYRETGGAPYHFILKDGRPTKGGFRIMPN